MPRPKTIRKISYKPDIIYFKPAGIRLFDIKEINLLVDELEAIRLKDYEGLDQISSAKKMGISQSTFHRLLLSARKKIADSLVNGKAIKIKGGNYKMMGRGAGRGAGRGRGFGGPNGECVCPKCGYSEPKVAGVPCRSKKCPKCGTIMVRKV